MKKSAQRDANTLARIIVSSDVFHLICCEWTPYVLVASKEPCPRPTLAVFISEYVGNYVNDARQKRNENQDAWPAAYGRAI